MEEKYSISMISSNRLKNSLKMVTINDLNLIIEDEI